MAVKFSATQQDFASVLPASVFIEQAAMQVVGIVDPTQVMSCNSLIFFKCTRE